MKMLAGFFGPAASPQTTPGVPTMPAAGELRKDPVCGTYVSTATDLKKTSKGETFYFCSPECRDKFA